MNKFKKPLADQVVLHSGLVLLLYIAQGWWSENELCAFHAMASYQPQLQSTGRHLGSSSGLRRGTSLLLVVLP